MLEIKSIRETLGQDYVKPDPTLVETYETALVASKKAQKYLATERGLTPETIQYFRLGYDKARDAIAIPIFKEGVLVNFKYRFINPSKVKYDSERNAETWVYHDAGFRIAEKFDRILIVEGEFDLMSVWQAGIKNVISPASGKNSYAPWIGKLDKIPEVFVAYDNDAGGQETAKEMSERIGTDKTFEVKYPDGIKDANEFFKTNGPEDFKTILKSAKPYYSHKFKSMGDIIKSIRSKTDEIVRIPFIPKVDIEKDWMIIFSGRSNVGKTSYSMNIADYLAKQGIATLVMPFERGIESVGKRFLQVKFEKSMQQLRDTDQEGWDKIMEECIETPVYFALPKKEDVISTIISSRRLFNTKVVIIDHLDYIVRSSAHKESEIGTTLQNLKRTAEENGVILLIVTHIRKIDFAGTAQESQRKPGIEDLKGSASLYQDPEVVVMLSSNSDGSLEVSIVKNKGEMTSQEFAFDAQTGKLSESLFDSM